MRHLTDDIDIFGKKVLIRVDFNVPYVGKKIEDDTRIIKTIPGIQALMKRGAKVILISHLGRPKGERVSYMSLEFIAEYLDVMLTETHVLFARDCIGKEVEEKIKQMHPGGVLVLENLRFYNEEEDNNDAFAKKLAALADFYVNDAFPCSHRAHASIVGVPKFLPGFIGPLFKEEIDALLPLFETNAAKKMAIVAGKKVSDKFKVLDNLSRKLDVIVVGGAMANTFLKAAGYEVGKSLYEKDLLESVSSFLQAAAERNCKVILPIDVVVEYGELVSVVDIADIQQDAVIYDLGNASVMRICEELVTTDLVLWNGPLGFFEDQRFASSTYFLARQIAKLTRQRKLTSVAGGGETISAIEKTGLVKDFSYISTAGGAFLEWLEEGTLPGVEILKY